MGDIIEVIDEAQKKCAAGVRGYGKELYDSANDLLAELHAVFGKCRVEVERWQTEALAARHLVYADGSASPVADLPFPFEAKAAYAKARAANEEGKKR